MKSAYLAFVVLCVVNSLSAQINWTGKTNVFIGDSNTEGEYWNPSVNRIDLYGASRFSSLFSSMKGSLEENNGEGGMNMQNAPSICGEPVYEDLIPVRTSNHLFLYIMLGSNDIANNTISFTPSAFQSRYQQLIDDALNKGWPSNNIVLISPPWVPVGAADEPGNPAVTGGYNTYYDYCSENNPSSPVYALYHIYRVDEARQQAYVNAVQAVATAKNAVFIDLYTAMNNHTNRSSLISEGNGGYDRLHLSLAGHQFVANTLADFAYPTALPLQLVSFVAQKENTHVRIRWTSENEENTKEFIVERADNRMQFQAIGKVQASGNSSTQKEYAFTDDQPLPRNNLYRLKMVDLDGKFEYSKTAMLSRHTSLSYSISPNPAKDNIAILANNKNPILLQIVDMSGRIVKQENLPGNGSVQNVNINHLTKGLYLIRLSDANDTHLEKLIVH